MNLKRIVLCLLVSIVSLTAGCGKKVDTRPAISLAIDIGGCSCEQYTEFQLKWSRGDDIDINCDELIRVIKEADQNGLLLCDCSHGKGDQLNSVVTVIDRLPNSVDSDGGLKIYLKQKTWLQLSDVNENLSTVLKGKERLLFSGRSFYLS